MKISIGPGAFVAAAFVGPGTVTACTLAGANFGYALIWTLVFATVATIILQDMASRLGVGARLGLGEALVHPSNGPILKWTAIILGFSALVIGNAAYEGGNIIGGVLGLETLVPNGQAIRPVFILAMGVGAAMVLLLGKYKLMERLLIGLVILMSLAFAGAIFVVQPDLAAIVSGLAPKIPDGGLLTSIALIGTTIVPYNLFLHASTARERWQETTPETVAAAKTDTRVSIGLGGLISILILSTAAATLFGEGITINNAADMAQSIEPAYGPLAAILISLGLFAAGMSSAITAPLATAYALTELTGAKRGGYLFKLTALGILIFGIGVALSGLRPIQIIFIAQVANGLLLPIVSIFLLITMNRRSLLGGYVNSPVQNVLGGLVVLACVGFGLRYILRALGVWP